MLCDLRFSLASNEVENGKKTKQGGVFFSRFRYLFFSLFPDVSGESYWKMLQSQTNRWRPGPGTFNGPFMSFSRCCFIFISFFFFFDFVLNVAGLDKLERKRIGLRHPSNSSADHKTNERIVSLEKCFVFSCFIFKLGMERES